jgi:hypothetical protein
MFANDSRVAYEQIFRYSRMGVSDSQREQPRPDFSIAKIDSDV